MTTAVEGGASLAWRLLATLEGGSLLLATSALLAYTARRKVARKRHGHRRPVKSVLITNTTNLIGQQIKFQLEARGCTVNTVTDELMQKVKSGSGSRVDALVVVGAEPSTACLTGLAEFVSQDVYTNLKVMETTSVLVKKGGCIAWACAGADADNAFSVAGAAFDAVIQASLQHVSKSSHCESIWIDRSGGVMKTAERVVAALVPCDRVGSRFSLRNGASKIGEYFGRWWKIVT